MSDAAIGIQEITVDKIAVLIPCYNEEKTIGKVVSDWKGSLPEAVIYVYDNNSTDRTAEIARESGAVVRHEYQQGKGNVIRRMFREIDARCYIMVDGDDTYPAEYGREMADLVLSKNADMVVGDRLSSTYFEENKRPFHNFGNSLVRGSINRLFKTNIRDIMTGYRAFSFLFVKSFPVLSKGFEIETEMSIHAVEKNMRIENVIIEYRDRPEGSESKLNTYSDGMHLQALQELQADVFLRLAERDPVRSDSDPVRACIHRVYTDRPRAEVPDSHSFGIHRAGRRFVAVYRPDPDDAGGEGPAGIRIPAYGHREYLSLSSKKSVISFANVCILTNGKRVVNVL